MCIVICTLNCKEYLDRCLKSIRAQDYPRDKVEIIVVDSFSTDGTLDIAKKYRARVILTKKRGYMEGKGMPKSIGCDKAKGKIIITIDSDNKLVEKDWIIKMVYPLINDKEIDYCICRMEVVKDDSLINQYLSMVGTDPFAIYCSLDSQISLGKVNLGDKEKYWVYKNTKKDFLITGGYYLAFTKYKLKEIGGYSRDVDVAYNLASRKNGAFIAIPKATHLHHLITTNTWDFFKKKVKWGKYYFLNKDKGDRKLSWNKGIFGKFGKIRFAYEILNNLLIIPNFLNSLKMFLKTKNKAWLIHSPVSFGTTIAYLIAYIKAY